MLSAGFPIPRAAYIHVPFCAHRCGYCDFTLIARRDDLIDDYLRALEIDLDRLEQRPVIDTLFFGGGTPTHLSAEQLGRLMEIVLGHFQLADGYEFSVEANPAALGDDKIAALAAAGVNRVSLGAQSFDAEVLTLLERDHSRSDIVSAVERLLQSIGNVSVDLIFGVPGQSLSNWKKSLTQAIDLQPTHVSTYGLTFEKGTQFWNRRNKGELRQAGEELERSMYAAAMDQLSAAGYVQYEISNFARPGFVCRHNEVYWRGLQFFGFGPGAARYIDGIRKINHRSVSTWLKRVFAGDSPISEIDELSAEDSARELLVLSLRRCEGVSKQEFQQQTGFDVDRLARKTIDCYTGCGLLEETDTHIRLTREGRFVADTVFVDLL
jgi:oxygen-independent coproporphyrinogen-3 oxidase